MSDKKGLIYALIYSGVLLIAAAVFTAAIKISGPEGYEDIQEPTPQLTASPVPTGKPEPTAEPTKAPVTPAPTAALMPELSEVLKEKFLDGRLAAEIGRDFLAIDKKIFKEFTVSINNLHFDRSLEIIFEGGENKSLEAGELYIVTGGELFRGAFKYEAGSTAGNRIEGLSIKAENTVRVALTSICEYRIYEDEDFYYISFFYPKEIYDRIIVVDAGHGGWDTGHYADGYSTLEKDCSLSIATELAELLKNEGIGVYLTRSADERVSNGERALIAEEVSADYLISIHCDDGYDGVSAAYSPYNYSEESTGARQLAEECLEAANEVFKLEKSEALADSDTSSLMAISKIPAVTVEFDLIKDKEQQKLAAEVILKAVLKIYNTMGAN